MIKLLHSLSDESVKDAGSYNQTLEVRRDKKRIGIIFTAYLPSNEFSHNSAAVHVTLTDNDVEVVSVGDIGITYRGRAPYDADGKRGEVSKTITFLPWVRITSIQVNDVEDDSEGGA